MLNNPMARHIALAVLAKVALIGGLLWAFWP